MWEPCWRPLGDPTEDTHLIYPNTQSSIFRVWVSFASGLSISSFCCSYGMEVTLSPQLPSRRSEKMASFACMCSPYLENFGKTKDWIHTSVLTVWGTWVPCDLYRCCPLCSSHLRVWVMHSSGSFGTLSIQVQSWKLAKDQTWRWKHDTCPRYLSLHIRPWDGVWQRSLPPKTISQACRYRHSFVEDNNSSLL